MATNSFGDVHPMSSGAPIAEHHGQSPL